MARVGCTCSSCVPSDPPVSAGSDARCPRGHVRVMLQAGRDRRGRFLQAWCNEPGCEATQLVRQAS